MSTSAPSSRGTLRHHLSQTDWMGKNANPCQLHVGRFYIIRVRCSGVRPDYNIIRRSASVPAGEESNVCTTWELQSVNGHITKCSNDGEWTQTPPDHFQWLWTSLGCHPWRTVARETFIAAFFFSHRQKVEESKVQFLMGSSPFHAFEGVCTLHQLEIFTKKNRRVCVCVCVRATSYDKQAFSRTNVISFNAYLIPRQGLCTKHESDVIPPFSFVQENNLDIVKLSARVYLFQK